MPRKSGRKQKVRPVVTPHHTNHNHPHGSTGGAGVGPADHRPVAHRPQVSHRRRHRKLL